MKYIGFLGNLYDCPLGHRENTCPVNPVEDLSFEEKFNWFEGLTIIEKDAILECHSQCTTRRTQRKAQE